ncbi:MAG: hypothetical protein RLO52_33250 [Sandaracinaceae bacterium]|nr:MAG: hypothetical protein EVA89_08890 [Sandaracinaceae bacterium]HBQ13896.1 hypothetical protein [Myxococcales bacterium]
MTVKSAAKEQVRTMREDLQQLRDRIRVKLHLASMELRDRFESVEPDVREFEHRAEKVTEEVGAELEEGWQHLKKALTAIDDELRGEKKKPN